MVNSRNIFIVLIALLFQAECWAGTGAVMNVKSDDNWKTKSSNLTWNMPNDYLIDGCSSNGTWSESCRGTKNTEGAIVFNMARKINSNGAYFCPTQVQITSDQPYSDWASWRYLYVDFYEPANAAPCMWICKDGFTGDECALSDNGNIAGNTNFKSLKKGDRRVSGEDNNKVDTSVDVFGKIDQYINNNQTWVHVLAILKYLDHGVLVGHLWVYGQARAYTGYSWVQRVHGEPNNGKEYLLCDTGYKANDAKTDCVLMKPDAVPAAMCDGWSEEEFNTNKDVYEKIEVNGCAQYRCKDVKKSFKSETDRTCVECASTVRSGISSTDGSCVSCDFGEYFDKQSGQCENALGLSRDDMRYGQGQTKSSVENVGNQCWTMSSPDRYKACVYGVEYSESIPLPVLHQTIVKKVIKLIELLPKKLRPKTLDEVRLKAKLDI